MNLERFGEELDELYARTKADLGERDVKYIRRVIRFQRLPGIDNASDARSSADQVLCGRHPWPLNLKGTKSFRPTMAGKHLIYFLS